MHRTTITEALLGTVVLFKTVFTMPDEAAIFQILDWLLVFIILMVCIEAARDWEKKIRKRRKRDGLTDIFEIELQLWGICKDYIIGGFTPKNEEMEACCKAFLAVHDCRIIVEENEKVRRAGTQTDK